MNRSFTLVVGLSGILLPHFVLSTTKLAHGSEGCPADVLVGKLGRVGKERRYKEKHQVTAEWILLHRVKIENERSVGSRD